MGHTAGLDKLSLGSTAQPDVGQHRVAIGETPREALGRFLRERREALAPEQVGISSHRGRRTPGLRREEVAFLADIGVKWYTRLEAGNDIHPSEATLTGIAAALRLSDAELEYMLDLAGLRPSFNHGSPPKMIPERLGAFIHAIHGVAATACDRILTPLLWNTASEALYGHSRCETLVERNGLVRALFDPEVIAFLGTERENLVFSAVGMLRLNCSSASPSPLANEVYERVKDHPLFQRAWQHRVVANELAPEEIAVRNHPALGRLRLYALDLGTTKRGDLFVRFLIPADKTTAAKFKLLERNRNEAVIGSTCEGDPDARLQPARPPATLAEHR
jgi:hypothetical protein